MSQVLKNDEMVIAEDALITQVQFAIHNLLEKKGISRSELAKNLNVSDARISQLFADEPENLTLKKIARIFFALDEEPRITCETLDSLIPVDCYVKKAEGKSAAMRSIPKVDVIAALVRDINISERKFQLECNDNDVGYDLAA